MPKSLETLATQIFFSLFISQAVSAQGASSADSAVAASIYDNLVWRPCVGANLPGCEVHVLRGVLEQGPSEVFIRFAPGARIPTFQHSVTERGLLLAGKLVSAATDGGEIISVTPGTYWYFPPRRTHGGLRCSDDGPCLIYEAYSGTFDVEIVARPPNAR